MLSINISTNQNIRRPSNYKLTAPPTSRKQVTWSPIEATAVDEFDHYDNDHNQNIWYTKQELHDIRLDNEIAASYCLDNNNNNNNNNDNHRGLEYLTEQGTWERYQHLRDCLNKVLDEQDRQRGIEKLEYTNSAYPLVKRANHLHIPFDHDRLAALCRDATANARRQARSRALIDLEEVQADYETYSIGIQEQEQPKTEIEVDTSKSAATTTTTTLQQSPPNTLSKQDSSINFAKTIEREHQQRFQEYLQKRQARIEAAAREALEREQRRLERASIIRDEVDTNLDQLKRIVDLSHEMMDLVLASSRA